MIQNEAEEYGCARRIESSHVKRIVLNIFRNGCGHHLVWYVVICIFLEIVFSDIISATLLVKKYIRKLSAKAKPGLPPNTK